MKEKIIALVDGNNFFVSCEILMNPSLKGKPVCVLSNNDGCVISRSYEAKKLGIKMGQPYFLAKKDFPDAIYLSANFGVYHELSQRMIEKLQNYSDKLDVYSIDEAFLDLTGLDKILKLSFDEIAKLIKNDIENTIGVSVSVGIANSKTLTKIATHKAKSQNGTYVISKENICSELKKIPIEEVWGIGRNISRSLKSYGVFSAFDILNKDDNFYKIHYGKKGLELKYELLGESVIPLTGIFTKPKSIQRTKAFPKFSKDKKYILAEIELHLHNVCRKLREYNLQTDSIYVMLRTKDFRVFVLEEKLDFSTNSELILTPIVKNLFDKMYDKEIIYRSAGVYASNLIDTEKIQLEFFQNEIKNKKEQISTIIDKIDNKYGKGYLAIGQIGIKSIQEKHKREMRHRTF
ncbi:MAG: hypothetical protein IJY61_00995 [Candidatus Gastranaerophilales bacterium]|nr:hypothetical protein [Candidatus Gastranaerophilales bacterium]